MGDDWMAERAKIKEPTRRRRIEDDAVPLVARELDSGTGHRKAVKLSSFGEESVEHLADPSNALDSLLTATTYRTSQSCTLLLGNTR